MQAHDMPIFLPHILMSDGAGANIVLRKASCQKYGVVYAEDIASNNADDTDAR